MRCYSAAGQIIQCCGHGLLAAAHSWQRRLQRDRLPLVMNGSVVPSWREGDLTWLRFASLRTRACVLPDWLSQLFPGSPPLAAATAGGEQGYLVLQWPDDFALQRLLPPVDAGDYTGRALICTAAQPQWGAAAVQLRYFAPQYGVVEDAATGSAMRVLAHYWSPRHSHLTAHQASQAGGLLLSRYQSSHVEVGGRCIDTEARADD
ncbi:MAG: PhzF family phenazine biosynthesis protein [Halioglobus sp.]|nr:PhzF family phenazine biosynthesis protein [Halioglobus sp.]